MSAPGVEYLVGHRLAAKSLRERPAKHYAVAVGAKGRMSTVVSTSRPGRTVEPAGQEALGETVALCHQIGGQMLDLLVWDRQRRGDRRLERCPAHSREKLRGHDADVDGITQDSSDACKSEATVR